MTELKKIRILIAQFQEETKSANVLHFITWLENRIVMMKEQSNQIINKRPFAGRRSQ